MNETNPIDHPRTYAALMEASDADGAHEVCELCAKLEDENKRLREAALAVITPLIMDTEVHPCDEMDMDKKAKACPYQVYALYRLCISLPNACSQRSEPAAQAPQTDRDEASL